MSNWSKPYQQQAISLAKMTGGNWLQIAGAMYRQDRQHDGGNFKSLVKEVGTKAKEVGTKAKETAKEKGTKAKETAKEKGTKAKEVAKEAFEILTDPRGPFWKGETYEGPSLRKPQSTS